MVRFVQPSESESNSKSSSESGKESNRGGVRVLVQSLRWKSAEYDMAEFLSPKGKRVGVGSDKDKLSISFAIPGRRILVEVISPSCSSRGVLALVGLIRWLEKPPDPLVMQTHEPKMKVVPASIAGKLKSKDAIKFFC